jgi:aspartyl-tRNA(Asn)/glutamyl-tRNA(Gln) amidotransferase subunit C
MITEKDVIRVARLARIKLAKADLARFTGELGKVLEFVETLNKVDTSKVAETAQVNGRLNVIRPDKIEPGLDRDVFLEGAPAHVDEQLKVKGIFS